MLKKKTPAGVRSVVTGQWSSGFEFPPIYEHVNHELPSPFYSLYTCITNDKNSLKCEKEKCSNFLFLLYLFFFYFNPRVSFPSWLLLQYELTLNHD